MTAPFIQGTQNNNKCPHGYPIGACPICNGMGGGGKTDRNTPRKPGEMTYNECMAAWIKIQAAQNAKIEAKLERLENLQVRSLENRITQGLDKIQKNIENVMKNVENLPQVIKAPIKFVVKNIIQPIMNLVAKLPVLINNIQGFFINVNQFVNSVSEKLAAVLGEAKNFINETFTKNVKKAMKTLLSFFAQGEEDEEEKEEKKKIKSKELKKVLKGIFKIKDKSQKEAEEEKEN